MAYTGEGAVSFSKPGSYWFSTFEVDPSWDDADVYSCGVWTPDDLVYPRTDYSGYTVAQFKAMSSIVLQTLLEPVRAAWVKANYVMDAAPVGEWLPDVPTPEPPAPLRFRQRHVHQSISDYLVGNLVALGWGNSTLPVTDPVNTDVNFGGVPMTFVETPPDEAGVAIAANSLSISIGDEPSDQEEQLGGGLISVGYPLIVDIYGQDHSISVSIAQDVKDLLSRRVIPLYSYVTLPRTAVVGSYIEFEEVVGPERPEGGQTATADSFRRYWRTMRATATTYFSQD